jgi:hypothetical protein
MSLLRRIFPFLSMSSWGKMMVVVRMRWQVLLEVSTRRLPSSPAMLGRGRSFRGRRYQPGTDKHIMSTVGVVHPALMCLKPSWLR